MAAPCILLPPEVLWNLSRLSRFLILSWNSSEEGDHATISLMFDKTKPSRITPASVRTKIPSVPLLPDLPNLNRQPPLDLQSDLLEVDSGGTRHQSVITISPDKTDRPKVTVKTEPKSPLRNQQAPIPKQTNLPTVKTEPNTVNVPQQTKLAPRGGVVSASAAGTRERIDLLLRSCRSESDRPSSKDVPDKRTSSSASIPTAIQIPQPCQCQPTPRDRAVFAEDRTITEKQSNASYRLSPNKRPDRKKVSAKKRPYKRDSIGFKATVFLKDSRKRKVFRKVNYPPSKRRSFHKDSPLTPATSSWTGDSSEDEPSKNDEDRMSTSDRNTESGDRDHHCTVEDFLIKIKKNICYDTPSRYNTRQCLYTLCDKGNSFHISCYSSKNRFTTVYSDITLQWLEKNSWKIPVFITQQAALRVLYRILTSRCPSDPVSQKERNLVTSLIY